MANRRYVKIGAPPSKKWWCSLLLSPQMVKLWFVFCSCRSASASSSKAWRRGRSSESSIASLSWHSRADALTRGGGGGRGTPDSIRPNCFAGKPKGFCARTSCLQMFKRAGDCGRCKSVSSVCTFFAYVELGLSCVLILFDV